MINLVMEVTTGSRFSATGRVSILSGVERLKGFVRLLWSILAAQLLHVLATANGTQLPSRSS